MAGALALTGCSTKAASNDSGGDAGSVKTGEGISGTTMTIGILGDFTGPFAALTTDFVRGIELYWDEVNEDGGVCNVYDVKLDTKDHGYNVQDAVSLFSQQSSNVLAYNMFVGGSHVAAVLDDAEAQNKVIIPASATQLLADSPVMLLPAPMYNDDSHVIVRYLAEEGALSEGGTIAAIYTEGDFGESALEGVEAAAEDLDLTVLPYQIKASDTDMTAAVNDALAKGAEAIFMGTPPTQTASTASVLAANGSDIAIGGSWPSYTTSLLDTPSADYLVDHFVAGSPATTYDTAEGAALYEKLSAAYPGETLTNQAAMGYGSALMLHQVLETACAAGDLTPAGVVEARANVGTIDGQGIMPDMDYSTLGTSPTTELFIFNFDPEVPGGLRNVTDGPFTNL
jgi:ABC-type branched-subunit amino acid transport system substrate-binding protein